MMALANGWSCLLLLCGCLAVLTGIADGRQAIPKPKSCHNADTWFRYKRRFVYTYEAEVKAGFSGTSDVITGSRLSCNVIIRVPKRCEMTIQLTKCSLNEMGLNGQEVQSPMSGKLAKLLEKDELYVQMDRGQVVAERMAANKEEPLFITNIKRAVVSQLQLPIKHWKEYQRPLVVHDQFGDCPTQITLEGKSKSIRTLRDISQCSLPQVFGRQQHMLSLAKQFQLQFLQRPINEVLYPFESKVACKYKIGGNKIAGSTCHHGQTFKPITFDGQLYAATAVNVTQTLSFKSLRKLRGDETKLNRYLKNRRLIDIKMELEVAPPQDVTSMSMQKTLDEIIVASASKSMDNLAPERFHFFVDLARAADSKVLKETLEVILACRKSGDCGLQAESAAQMEPATVQKQRESFFTDGLLSCGTEACVATYLTCVQSGVISPVQTELSLLNMALFYEPAPAALTNMLALCQPPKEGGGGSRSNRNCWLTLGTLTSRLATALSEDQQKSVNLQEGRIAVRKALHHLRGMVGDACSPKSPSGQSPPLPAHLKQAKLSSVLLGLKSLANAGGALGWDKDGEGLASSLLQCINNPQLQDSIPRAALTVLSKMELTPTVHKAFMTLLTDVTKPLALRTMAFDRLLRHHDSSTVHQLVDIVRLEKLAGLQTYMATRVGHLLESNLPEGYSLRTLWRSALRPKPLPILEEVKGRASQYAEVARYVEIPLTQHQVGAKLGLGLVFEPSNLVPSQLRVMVSFLLFNHSVDLLEVGVDMQGFENIMRELLTMNMNAKELLGAGIARLLQAMLPKKAEVPTLFFPDLKVVEALRKLLVKVNMPSGDARQAQLHVKMFGSEVGYVDVQDVIQMVMGGVGQKAVVPLAKKLSQGLQYYVGKSSKLVEVVRMFPTVAGLPWRAEVHSSMVAFSSLNVSTDSAQFMSRRGPLTARGGIAAKVGVRVTCEESVAIGDMTSSGVRLNVSVLVNGARKGRLLFAPSPEAHKLQLGMGPLQEPITLVSARSDIYQLHNGQEMEILTPRTQTPIKKCVPEFYQRWSGHKVCVEGFYQDVPVVPNNPMPFVSGPMHLDVTSKGVDRALKEYTATFTLKRQEKPGPLIIFVANFSAPGEKLKRHLEMTAQVNPKTRALRARARVPEYGLLYTLDVNSSNLQNSGESHSHHLVSSILTIGPQLMHSFIMEMHNEKTTALAPPPAAAGAAGADHPGPDGKPSSREVSGMLLKVNVSLPGLSLEVVSNSSSGKQPGIFTQAMHIRYYCEPELGILYALHGSPALAASNGHVSLWSFNNRATLNGKSFAQTWKASDTMAILIPGHNVTVVNHMTANFSRAVRNTIIYWTCNIGTPNVSTDIITMDAEVRNNSVGRHQDVYYVMKLDHQNQYNIEVDGSLKGPMSNMKFKTDIGFKAKGKRRERRSLRSITSRLRRMEEKVEKAVESIEAMVIRRGAELTEAFLKWMAGEPEPEKPGSKKAKDRGPPGAGGGPAVSLGLGDLSADSVMRLFRRPSWKLVIDGDLKFEPAMLPGSSKPAGYDVAWDLTLTMPQFKKKNLLAFNGTMNRLKRFDINTDWRLHSDVLNFTLTYFMQQRVNYPQFYHWHRWNVEEFTKHRYDRSFSFLVDLERQDHFIYHLHLVSPRTNVSHQINFTTSSPQLRTVRASLNFHNANPVWDIKYRERSDLMAKKLTTDVSLSSTWLDFALDSDVEWPTPGALIVTQRMDSLGKVLFFKGPSRMDINLKMDMQNLRKKPSMTVRHNTTTGQIRTMVGQLLSRDHVFFTFSAQKPGSKKTVTLINWHIRLLEPTLLQHSLSWEAHFTKSLFDSIYRFYRSGAQTFLLFGQTVADNVYRNVSDMVVPFTNVTISQAVERVVQGRLKQVAMGGLDPKKNVPVAVKVLKGGLKVVQALQLSWQNSQIGRLAYNVGVHKAVSTAAWLSTRLHFMVVQDPPFPLKQYIKFYLMPNVQAAAASRQFNFTVPLPFVWHHYLSWPQPRLLRRQLQRPVELMGRGSEADLPFFAIVTRTKIRTFDGAIYDIRIPKKTKCSYLLGTDLMVKNQSLLLSEGRPAMAFRNSSVIVGWDGAVHITDNSSVTPSVSELPAELPNDQVVVSLTNGQLTVGVEGQMRMTYDPASEMYVVEMAGHLHNRSLGMLGTPTREPGDDFRLPSGQIENDPKAFQEKYELSGRAECAKSVAVVSAVGCPYKAARPCQELFQDADSSPLAPCFSTVDPQHFLDLCLRRTCEILPTRFDFACPVISTYVKLCTMAGQKVEASTSAFKETCEGCVRSSKAVDMVMCPAVGSADRSPNELRAVIGNLAAHVTPGARFGLVHGHKKHAHAHLFDGDLFVPANKLQEEMKAAKMLMEEKENKGQDGRSSASSVAEVLETAANYPFRAGARRFVVVFTGPNTVEPQNVTELQNRLRALDVSLIQVSAHLDSARVLSASWDSKVVLCRGCRKDRISIATTQTGKLAANTRGMYMSFDALKKGRSARMRKLLRPYEYILRQPSQKCASVVKEP